MFEDIKSELDEFISGFDDFLSSKQRNAWIYGGHVISVYVRKGYHYINGSLINTLDIGTIDVDEEYQNRGIGTYVINYLHKQNPFPCTFIESILNTQLHERLLRQGWQEVPNAIPPCVFKFKS